jgi:hypothetical protein
VSGRSSSVAVSNGVIGLVFIEPDKLIELLRQHRLEIVTGELGFGPVDHPYRIAFGD